MAASSSFLTLPVDSFELESLLDRLPRSLPGMPAGLAPVKIGSTVARHDLDPMLASLPPSELRETLRQTAEHAYPNAHKFRRSVKPRSQSDPNVLWFKPPTKTDPGPPVDCVALALRPFQGSSFVTDILIASPVVWGLQCSRIPSLRSRIVRHPREDLLGIPLIPLQLSYPTHIADLDEHLYRVDLEWLRATLLFERPPESVPRSQWRSGSESRFEALSRAQLLDKLRHVYACWHNAVDLGLASGELFGLLQELYSWIRARCIR